MSAESLLSLHDKLREDRWRAKHAFSKDIQQAARLMLKPFAYEHEIAEALRHWCMKRQPCQFGRAAANRGQIYFCILHKETWQTATTPSRRKFSQQGAIGSSEPFRTLRRRHIVFFCCLRLTS